MATGDGLVSMTPTSIAAGSGTATINADGGVDFSAVTSLSLNGVFTSDYDNYLIVMRHSSGADAASVTFRLRALGTDASAGNYTQQFIYASLTTLAGNRNTSQTSWRVFYSDDGLRSGNNVHLYGPNLAQPTAYRSIGVSGYQDAYIEDLAGTHSLSTAYDGCTFISSGITGNVHVFGYEE
jgi:hypothetical protein